MHKNNKLGYDPFVWWTGVVEDRQDPLKIGRCRVRIIGTHTDDKTILPTASLPWAHPLQPINNPNSYTPKEGDMVVGFFMDSIDGQFPIMFGLVPGIATKKAIPKKGFYDDRSQQELDKAPVKPDEKPTNYPRNLDEPTTSRLARNEDLDKTIVQTKKDNKFGFEPNPYYNAVYPYNNVYESESGHVMEFDDTKDAERIHLYHRSGSYIEWGPNGDRSERIEKNKYTVVAGDDKIYVKGDVDIVVLGSATVTVAKNATVTAGLNITATAGIDASVTAGVDASVTAGAVATITAPLTNIESATTNISGIVNIGGALNVTGLITAESDVVTGTGVSLDQHVHSGVRSGESLTGYPVP